MIAVGVPIETRMRELAPEVLAVLVRRHGNFDRCEDALQEALLMAARQWPAGDMPNDSKAWLITVASRRWTELWRNETARTRREQGAVALEPTPPDPSEEEVADDLLNVLLLCCHPALTVPSQVALTLRAVGGLTTAEIARGLLVPEATVAQRISRAKQRIRAAGATFSPPSETELRTRLDAVLRVLYLIFTEGSTASSGVALHRVELSAEALRLARQLHADRSADGEIAGLLALMLLTDARRPARTRPDGTLVPLAEQERARWDRGAIAEGTELVTTALSHAPVGPFQLQGAIAAVHAEAPRAEDTDWQQILGLYELLRRFEPGPMTTLGRIVAIAMVQGTKAGLRELDEATADPVLREHHRAHAVRAHLLDMTGAHDAARVAYREAARRTLSVPEQRYLAAKAADRPRRPS